MMHSYPIINNHALLMTGILGVAVQWERAGAGQGGGGLKNRLFHSPAFT